MVGSGVVVWVGSSMGGLPVHMCYGNSTRHVDAANERVLRLASKEAVLLNSREKVRRRNGIKFGG